MGPPRCRRKILLRGGPVRSGRGDREVWNGRPSRSLIRTHTRPQNSRFCRIASRISGSHPALATAGSGGRWHFFCSRHEQFWLRTTTGMGPKMLEPMERRNPTSLVHVFPQNPGDCESGGRLSGRDWLRYPRGSVASWARVALRVRHRKAEHGAGLSCSPFPNNSPARPALGKRDS